MSDALYEQYKDALRRGHVAALHGQLEASLAAYDEAAAVVADRPLPHTSRGVVLARMGRADEALAAFDAALALAPRDEASLDGRAVALMTLGRRVDAAATFDRLAAAAEAAGRLVPALDAARRALETAESRGRREIVQELSARVGASEPDEAARAALERAMRVLEQDPRRMALPAEDAVQPGDDVAGRLAPPEAGPGPAAEPPDVEPEPEPIDLAALTADADAAIASGDAATGREALLTLARAHRRGGRVNAAIDACYLALSLVPDDVDLHLELVGLYDQRGWTTPAAEKLALLRRLVELDGDTAAADRVAAAAGSRPGWRAEAPSVPADPS